MLLKLLFRQTARFERPVLVPPIFPTLRRLLLLRCTMLMASPTRPSHLEPALFRHRAPFGQLFGVSSFVHSQQARVAHRLGAQHDGVADGHNGHRPGMGGRRLRSMGGRALPRRMWRLACGRR